MAVNVTSNAAQIHAELGRTSARTTRRLAAAVREAGVDMRDEWRRNATETAGAHGKHYPKSIKVEQGILEAAIYPDESMKQGGMGVGFEFGSVNQPPHLDGQRALDTLAPLIQRRLEAVLAFD